MSKTIDLNMDSVQDYKDPVWNPCLSIPDFPELNDSSPEDLIEELLVETFRISKFLGVEKDTMRLGQTGLFGWEVGDDRLDISNNPFSLCLSLAAQEKIFRFETSWKDTGISKRLWNFCEVTSNVPSSTLGDIKRAKKTGFADLDYVDTPPLRIIADVSKARPEEADHSSSITGKSEMLGNRIKSCRTNLRSLLEISSYLQDGMLSTCNSPDPKYLPGIMGGCSCPSLFGVWQNTYAYLLCYKGGTYQRVYGTAINELIDCVRDMDNQIPSQPVVSSFLRKRQELLHLTYGANVVIPEDDVHSKVEEVFKPLYKAAGGMPILQGVENRLVQAKMLLTKAQAEKELDIRFGIKQLLFDDNSVVVQRAIRKTEKALLSEAFAGTIRANAAFQRMLAGTANDSDLKGLYLDGRLITGSGKTKLNAFAVEWISKGGNGEIFTINDLTKSEDMYVYDEVSESRSLRVSAIQLTPLFNNRKIIQTETRSEIGLWQITEGKKEWAERLLSKLLNLRNLKGTLRFQDVYPIMVENCEWVNDDSLLIRRLIQDVKGKPKQTILLLSSDMKLAKNAAKTTGFPVALVDPQSFVVNNAKEVVMNSGLVLTPNQVLNTDLVGKNLLVGHPPVFDIVYIDTGSLEAYAQRMVIKEGPNNTQDVMYRRLQRSGFSESGARYEVQTLQKLKGELVPKVRVFYPNETVYQSASVIKQMDTGNSSSITQRVMRGLRRFPR